MRRVLFLCHCESQKRHRVPTKVAPMQRDMRHATIITRTHQITLNGYM
jgi:hypothetical protein